MLRSSNPDKPAWHSPEAQPMADGPELRDCLPAIARDLPAIAMCAVIPVTRRAWRWQAGASMYTACRIWPWQAGAGIVAARREWHWQAGGRRAN